MQTKQYKCLDAPYQRLPFLGVGAFFATACTVKHMVLFNETNTTKLSTCEAVPPHIG